MFIVKDWFSKVSDKFINLLKDEEGVTAIEYALIASLISVAIVLTIIITGNFVGAMFIKILNALIGVF